MSNFLKFTAKVLFMLIALLVVFISFLIFNASGNMASLFIGTIFLLLIVGLVAF